MEQQGNTSSQEEMQELKDIGLTVWGEEQTTLEQQALNELQTFQNNLKDIKKEAKPEETPVDAPRKQAHLGLDVSQYIKQQEELRKRQEYKRSLIVVDKNTQIANDINKKQIKSKKVHASSDTNTKLIQRKRHLKENTATIDENTIKVEPIDNNLGIKVECDKSDGSEYIPSDDDGSDYEKDQLELVKPKRLKLTSKPIANNNKYEKVIDDGDQKTYDDRLNQYYMVLEEENRKAIENSQELPETEIQISGNLKCTTLIWNKLYSYQCEGVEWMYGIHQKVSGGLLGDEMGLGKTVEVIAFLYSLNYSKIVSSYGGFKGLGPTLIVCPSTVIHQWVKHFHDWAPEFRVAILHQSGSYSGDRNVLIKDVLKSKSILVTSYQSMLNFKYFLVNENWHYVILDEGHKIRNPNAQISEAVKTFKTPYRLLLTGSPMQNNLQELWSLFDFTNPGMLGTLPVFLEHFAMPIMQGGYSNATPMQESLALSMATALKNMITPHLLRRAKIDVKDDICLPKKSEQVLFCSITPEQRDLYKGYLMSDHISNLLGRSNKKWYAENYTRANVLMSVTTLRKICNHPEIYLSDLELDEVKDTDDQLDFYKRSGKMVVVAALLKMWKRQSHRVLLFTQSRAMVALFEKFLRTFDYKYLKMDGATSISSRQPLIDKFNNDKSIDVFVLTTRVGGLGVNLTGADRVIIYDPDWNPATDTQARERAWRIGQDKEVTIYRLLSAGTIEEKIYQRQVWKQLLSNKVLIDPATQKFFKSSDLYDLFSLQDYVDNQPETTNIFESSRINLEEKLKSKKKKPDSPVDVKFSEDKIQQMKELAAQISKNLTKSTTPVKEEPLDPYQIELREEREEKLKKRAKLKRLTPVELLNYNREIGQVVETEPGNQLDDCDTDVTFRKALVIAGKAAELYNTTKVDPKNADGATEQYKELTEVFRKPEKEKHRKDIEIDESGQIEGEKVDGLLKRECKRAKKKSSRRPEDQDQYVLSKLFTKKGVQSALQHDNVVQCTPATTSLKVHNETEMRTNAALRALRKSRITLHKY